MSLGHEHESFREYMRHVEEAAVRVGELVVAKIVGIEHDGLIVTFGGTGDGFVPLEELDVPDLPLSANYELDGTLQLQVTDLDNTNQLILLSEKGAALSVLGDGVDGRGRRSAYSHFTRSGAPKQSHRSRSDALSAARETHSNAAGNIDVYRCHRCGSWHVGHTD